MLRITIIVLAVMVFRSTSYAEPVVTYNRVSFSVTASEEVASDLLVVRLFAKHDAPSQAVSADRVKQDIAWALAAAT